MRVLDLLRRSRPDELTLQKRRISLLFKKHETGRRYGVVHYGDIPALISDLAAHVASEKREAVLKLDMKR